MKKLTMGLLITAAVIVLGWLCLSTAYTHTVSEEVTRIRRESRSDVVYLRTRIRELESELTSLLLNRTEPDTEAADSEADTTESVAPETEEVTVPTHQSPETQPSVETHPTPDVSTAAYMLTEHNGVIGIFDASGELVRVLNVFVMTLPETEREALRVGIPAYSYEEMLRLAQQYE